jgi:hypothetical protein
MAFYTVMASRLWAGSANALGNAMFNFRPRLAAFAVLAVAAPALADEPAPNMSFFVTSTNPGKGGDLGGLAGADAYCKALATAVGVGSKTWRAYLSTTTVDARDRIGNGPWYNATGVKIAANIAELHGDNNKITAETALTEKGTAPNYVGGPEPLQHDMLTGTNADGTAAAQNCNNWTDGSAESQAMLGHADRRGRTSGVNSWSAVHPSLGCSLAKLARTGSAGLYYCFAAD